MHVAIAGNIGAGKTTLTKLLAKHYKWEPHFESVEEKFRKVPTGKRVLGEECYWCDYKFSCWPNLEYKPQEASSAREPRWFYYTNEEEVSLVIKVYIYNKLYN